MNLSYFTLTVVFSAAEALSYVNIALLWYERPEKWGEDVGL